MAPLRVLLGRHGCTGGLEGDRLAGREATIELVDEPTLIGGFRRMVREEAYDVCELALTTYLCAKAHGKRFTALPVFLVRAFHHGAVLGLPPARAAGPSALAGARVGVRRGYTVTTGVWARGVLDDEHGVDPSSVTWVRSGDEHVLEQQLPPNVEEVPPGHDLAGLLAAGQLAAVIGGRYDLEGLGPLIPDPLEAGFRALAARGHYPINHCLVVRDAILDADPGIVADLFEAFVAAKGAYLERLLGEASSAGEDRLYREVASRTGADPLPYGLEANRRVLDELVRHARRQRLLEDAPPLEALLVPGSDRLAGGVLALPTGASSSS